MRIADVRIGNRVRRVTDSSKVAELAESIGNIGLVNPISVSEDLYLLAGLHRLEACKMLGLVNIDETIVPFQYDSPNAELVELDENLIRSELTVLERSEQLLRRKVLYEQVHPETRYGYGPGRGHTEKSGNDFRSFSDDASDKLGVTPRTVRQEVQIAKKLSPEVKDRIRDTELANNKTALLRLARMEPVQQAREVQNIESRKISNYHVSDDTYEWFTPEEYIDAAVMVMGGIDLDPASCEVANEVVRAAEFYTKENDGLSLSWYGKVFLNPPYNMPKVELFVDKVIDEFSAGNIEQAIVLTNNSTDTKWFHKLLAGCPVCFTSGRISFWGASGETLATRQGQALFYLGQRERQFAQVFSRFGIVVQSYDH